MKKAPYVNTPQELPELRAWLVDLWEGLARSQHMNGLDQYGINESTEDILVALASETSVLRHAGLWWVSPDMCQLVAAAADSIPDDLIGNEVPYPEADPSPSGLVVFANRIHGIDAMSWCRDAGVTFKAHGGPAGRQRAVVMSTYRRLVFEDGLTPEDLQIAAEFDLYRWAEQTEITTSAGPAASLTGAVWVNENQIDWVGIDRIDDTSRYDFSKSQARHPQTPEDHLRVKRVLAALWLLLREQGIAETTEEHLDRAARRRIQRKTKGDFRPVQLVRLRRSERSRGQSDGEGGGVEWSHRWMVRPHFRWQPYGKDRAKRKLIFIAPYIKGPADRPLAMPTRVNVLVR